MKDKFESALLESGEMMRKSAVAIINNAGRVVAVITLVISSLVLFTDLRFADFGTQSFTSTLAVMLVCSYLMFFSMSEAGENSAESSREYMQAKEKYLAAREKVGGDMIPRLRSFCKSYAEDELNYRIDAALIRHGSCAEDYKLFKSGKRFDKKTERIFRRISKMRAVALTPKILLSAESARGKSELSNPEKTRFLAVLLRLLPSTICMTVTVSVMLTAKEDLSAEVIADGIFKLSSLLLIGFKGYVSGYKYKKEKLALWLQTKSGLIEAFISSDQQG